MSSWWREMSGQAKFRLYTKVLLQIGVVGAVVAIAVSGGGSWLAAGVVVAGLATLVALEAQPEVVTRQRPVFRRRALPAATVVLAGVWVAFAVAVHRAATDGAADEARTAGVFVLMLAMLSIISFTPLRWWLVVAASVATGFAFEASSGSPLLLMAKILAISVFVVGATLVTLWGLRIVDDLERNKDLAAELQLAEERLRFGRDLHDVVGRSFSVIAVKSELAATLSRTGDFERAGREMREVKAIAVESMEEMRTLVRGYRDIDLAGEVAGARSLLSSTGCRLAVQGDPAKVPHHLHEVAAWVVREGVTNVVRHSCATTATLTLGTAGMSLRNNGVTRAEGERSGLLGLAERLSARGATLDTVCEADEFTLEIHWETS